MSAGNSYTKYPRTAHLPWSPGRSDDDIALESTLHLELLADVVVTEKLDGENTTLYRDRMHARSLDSRSHPSRDWLKRLHAALSYDIPAGIRICGENVFARHSVPYDRLTTFFYAFAVFEEGTCLSWNETVEWCALLGIETVPVLYRGLWNEVAVRSCWIGTSAFGPMQEGYVVRNADPFAIAHFGQNVAKFVRAGHVTTEEHWMSQPLTLNGLIGSKQDGRQRDIMSEKSPDGAL